MLLAEAARVFGAELRDVVDARDAGGPGYWKAGRWVDCPVLRIWLTGQRMVEFMGRSKAGARRFAYEMLRKMPSKDGRT